MAESISDPSMDGSVFNLESLPLITQIRLKTFAGDFGGRICMNIDGITPQQQKGPTCGLVALSMCLEHFGVHADSETILEKAKKLGFTKQGEMYSAEFLSDLTNEFLPDSSKVCDFPSAASFARSICDGKHFLIAYDCGPNYQPVNVKGNSAHWLLACGFLGKTETFKSFVETRETTEESTEIAIIGFQGKSTNLNVFPFVDVVKSNAQLQEAGTKRDPNDYIIPDPNNLSEIRNRVVEISMNIR